MFDAALLQLGFSQLDTRQDASYYENWFNPKTLEQIEYAEGDVTRTKFDSPDGVHQTRSGPEGVQFG